MSCKMKYSDKTRDELHLRCLRHRKETGSSHAQLAATVGVTPSSLSQYLNGGIPLNTDFILSLCRVLGISPGECVDELCWLREEVAA